MNEESVKKKAKAMYVGRRHTHERLDGYMDEKTETTIALLQGGQTWMGPVA